MFNGFMCVYGCVKQLKAAVSNSAPFWLIEDKEEIIFIDIYTYA